MDSPEEDVTPDLQRTPKPASASQFTSPCQPGQNTGTPLAGITKNLFTSPSKSKVNYSPSPPKKTGETLERDRDGGFIPPSPIKGQGTPQGRYPRELKKIGLFQNASGMRALSPMKNKAKTPTKTPPRSDRSPGGLQSGSPSSSFNFDPKDKSRFRDSPGMYLENFVKILHTVISEPDDARLFNEEDTRIILSLWELSLPAQKLYVRLFQRKITWHKISKIFYDEICSREDLPLIVDELTQAGFLAKEDSLTDLPEVCNLLLMDELKKLCKMMKITCNGKKEDIVASLLKYEKKQPNIMTFFGGSKSKQPSAMLQKAKSLVGPCCRIVPEVRRVFLRALMLFGLPRCDDDEDGGQQAQLWALLRVNLGLVKFPSYATFRTKHIFRSRDDLLRFETCSQIQMEVLEHMEAQRWQEALDHCEEGWVTYQDLLKDHQLMEHEKSLPDFLRRFTAISLLVYVLTCSVECLQRLRDYRAAVQRLRVLLGQTTHLQDHRGRWYDRLALNLENHLKQPAEAIKVIREALNDPEVRKGHRLSLCMRIRKMTVAPRYKSLAPTLADLTLMTPREAPKHCIRARSVGTNTGGFRRMYILEEGDDGPCSLDGQTYGTVEELAISHYQQLGYTEGLHRESTTVRSLFGIYFWESLYVSLPDAFHSPHQAAPLDLDHLSFYLSRRDLIDARLEELRHKWTEEEAEAELDRVWGEHHGEMSLVNWDTLRCPDYAKSLVRSLGLGLLAAICERLALDHRFTRSGFPDLVVWDPAARKCCIVEVKGPNDNLSTKQILWLDYLLEHGAKAEVCHVEAIGAKRLTKKSSPKKKSPKKVNEKTEEDKAEKSPRNVNRKSEQMKKERKTKTPKIMKAEEEEEKIERKNPSRKCKPTTIIFSDEEEAMAWSGSEDNNVASSEPDREEATRKEGHPSKKRREPVEKSGVSKSIVTVPTVSGVSDDDDFVDVVQGGRDQGGTRKRSNQSSHNGGCVGQNKKGKKKF